MASIVCGPPGRFFDVMSFGRRRDGNGLQEKSTGASEIKEVRLSVILGCRQLWKLRVMMTYWWTTKHTCKTHGGGLLIFRANS